MHQEFEVSSKKFKASHHEFYTYWNIGAEHLNQFTMVTSAEDKYKELFKAREAFMSAKELCSKPDTQSKCNEQLLLIIDKNIEVYYQEISESQHINWLDIHSNIQNIEREISNILSDDKCLNHAEMRSLLYFNLGSAFYDLIAELDETNLQDLIEVANHAKDYFGKSWDFAMSMEVSERCQEMLARLHFDVAALLKLDLSSYQSIEGLNFNQYYAWFKIAFEAYYQDRTLCKKQDMLDLTQFTLEQLVHQSLDIQNDDVELNYFKRLLLNLSRTSKLEDAKTWKVQFDKLDRFMDSQKQSLEEEISSIATCTTSEQITLDGYNHELQNESIFSSLNFFNSNSVSLCNLDSLLKPLYESPNPQNPFSIPSQFFKK